MVIMTEPIIDLIENLLVKYMAPIEEKITSVVMQLQKLEQKLDNVETKNSSASNLKDSSNNPTVSVKFNQIDASPILATNRNYESENLDTMATNLMKLEERIEKLETRMQYLGCYSRNMPTLTKAMHSSKSFKSQMTIEEDEPISNKTDKHLYFKMTSTAVSSDNSLKNQADDKIFFTEGRSLVSLTPKFNRNSRSLVDTPALLNIGETKKHEIKGCKTVFINGATSNQSMTLKRTKALKKTTS